MKKRYIIWVVFFVSVLISLPALLLFSAFCIPPQYDETYLGEMQEKMERLKSVTGSKLVIVGGSSVAFAVRSDLLEEQLGMMAVNFGLYAPLGSRTMLEACFDEVGYGDIVVFSPELSEETLSFAFQAREVWQAMDGDFSLLKIFDETQKKQLLGAFPEFAVSKLRYALKGKPAVTGIYRKASFNQFGDISSSERMGNCMPEGYDPTQLIDFSYFPEGEFIAYLNEYAAKIRKRGASFYYRFCPMNESAVVNGELLDDWFKRLDNQSDFTILGNPHDCVMESGWFYDTNFHLNDAGAAVNTYRMIRDLKAQLHDSSPTDISLPEMPDSIIREISGDNSDEDCFLYEIQGEDYMIVGVSQQALPRGSLTLPYEHKGRRVTALGTGALKGCENLRAVKIYGGISLYDGCFAGCGDLERIELWGKPSDITAGRELLGDCEALLYTPYADEYRMDYSWGLYGGKIREAQD